MLQVYVNTFSKLAIRYNAYVVAGSILSPEFTVDNLGKVHPSGDEVFNISAIFDPRGHIIAKVRKFDLTPSERGFVDPGSVSNLRPVRTPVGVVGLMICADGWSPKAYKAYRNTDILVQPSFLESVDIWNKPWQGKAEDDPQSRSVALTEGQAWKRYSLQGRFSSTNARVGVNVFLMGRLWDMHMGGRSFIISRQHLDGIPAIMEASDIFSGSALHIEFPPDN
jgi:predicted amidohydrolase